MSRLPFYFIVGLLVLLGISLAYLRHVQTHIPFLPGVQTSVWLVEAKIDYIAKGPSTVSLALPEENPHFALFSEQATSPGYGFSIVNHQGQRRGVWSKREVDGLQTLYYKAQFVSRENHAEQGGLRPAQVRKVYWQEPEATAAAQIIAAAKATSSNALSLTRELIKQLDHPELNQNAALLLAYQQNKAKLLADLLNEANISAHVVQGLFLEDARRRQPLVDMLEIFVNDSWQVVNTETGEQGVPDNLLLWQRSDNGLLDIMGGFGSQISFSMIKQTVPALQLVKSQMDDSLFHLFSVYRLPIEVQSMFKMLFLLPIGAFLVVFMRLIVGLKTSGTFMPILLSLAFLHTQLVPGLISFVSIVAFGLLLRGYLSKLNLLMIARIATLITLVVFIIAMMSLVGYRLGLNTGMTTTFFPMIIIAWTIERMSILWEEEGPREVLAQGSGSLFVAVLAYLIMTLPLINHLSFNFPELNLVVMAMMLLMGQYTGYRLSELRRFSDLMKVIRHVD